MSSSDSLPFAWSEIANPPEPYLHARRRFFPHGLHVVVLATSTEVISRADHGVPHASRIAHGRATTPVALARLFTQACDYWDRCAAGLPSATCRERRYHYLKPDGGFSDPVSIDALFHLIAQARLAWSSQVWLVNGPGAWEPITRALGFPQPDDIIVEANP